MNRSVGPARSLAVVAFALIVSGCGASSPPVRSTESALSIDAAPLAIEDPTGSLALRDVLALTLRGNPELEARAAGLRVREAEAEQANLRPNPELGIEAENLAGTGATRGVESLETTLVLSQWIELGGQRGSRHAAARRALDASAIAAEVARVDVLAAATVDFVAVVAAQQRLRIAEESVGVAEEVLDAVARRVRAGATSAVEERRARVSLETARIDVARAAGRLRAARGRLVTHWGADHARFDEAVADLDALSAVPGLDALTATVDASPSLAQWAAEIARLEAERDLRRAEGTMNVAIDVGVRHSAESEDVSAVVGLRLPLRIFDRNQGAIDAAVARLRQADHERRVLRTSVRARLVELHADATLHHVEATALRERVLPEATEAFALARDAYDRGRMPLTDVLQTERTLFALRARLVDVQQGFHTAVAGLERTLGAPLSEIDPNPGDR